MNPQFQNLNFNDLVSGLLHLFAGFLALYTSPIMLNKAKQVLYVSLYLLSLIMLFLISGTYHLLKFQNSPMTDFFRILDFAMIWLFIAGTITGILCSLENERLRRVSIFSVWVILIFFLPCSIACREWLSLSLFLTFGWGTGLFTKSLLTQNSTLFALGGSLFSISAIVDQLDWPTLWPHIFGAHELFHLLIILGASIHWVFIYRLNHVLIEYPKPS